MTKTIRTVEQLAQLPIRTILKTHAGTAAQIVDSGGVFIAGVHGRRSFHVVAQLLGPLTVVDEPTPAAKARAKA